MSRESATIYTFPARGRFAIGAQREDSNSVANVQLPGGVKLSSGSGWYHEEAIRAAMEADRGVKN
jgi:hypothetical protein